MKNHVFRKLANSVKTNGIILLLIVLFFFCMTRPGLAMTGDEIIKKVDQNLRGKSSVGESAMTIITPNWTRTIGMKFWSKGEEKFFIHILSPPREENITFLKKGNLLYQYLPSAEMRIKITPSMMHQSWMGSDFTNDDLVKESSIVHDYNHQLLGEEKMDGRHCYKIQLNPKPNAPVVWGKLMIWIDKHYLLPVKEEFFNENGEKIKVLSMSKVEKTNDRYFPMHWEMVPLNKEGHKTILDYKYVKFNVKIDRNVFTLRNLEKPR